MLCSFTNLLAAGSDRPCFCMTSRIIALRLARPPPPPADTPPGGRAASRHAAANSLVARPAPPHRFYGGFGSDGVWRLPAHAIHVLEAQHGTAGKLLLALLRHGEQVGSGRLARSRKTFPRLYSFFAPVWAFPLRWRRRSAQCPGRPPWRPRVRCPRALGPCTGPQTPAETEPRSLWQNR